MAEENSVDQITDGTTQYQRESSRQNRLAVLSNSPDPNCNDNADNARENDEKPALPTTGICQKAERGTRVLLVSEIDERVERHLIVQRHPFYYRPLSDLIGDDNNNRNDHPHHESGAGVLRCTDIRWISQNDVLSVFSHGQNRSCIFGVLVHLRNQFINRIELFLFPDMRNKIDVNVLPINITIEIK